MSSPQIIRPTPRPMPSLDSPQQSTPILSTSFLDETPSRTHSNLNLTSSTLLGIFSPTVYDPDQENASSPGGISTTSPRKNSSPLNVLARPSILARPSKKVFSFSLGLRIVLLFATGMCYGLLLQNLHNKTQYALFEVGGVNQQKLNRIYLFLWGISGVAFGSLLPRVDTSLYFDETHVRGSASSSASTLNEDMTSQEENILRQNWTPVIRSVGAFIGIAYALRKLPWSSTFQESLALCLINPALWYLIDRSKSGFLLSLAVGATGTTLLLASKSKMTASLAFQSPLKSYNSSLLYGNMENNAIMDLLSKEGLEDAMWILSVLFCSCVCFGNIGRKLAPNGRD